MKISKFVNELGNSITIKVNKLGRSVNITITGPKSTTTDKITVMEAKKLRDLLTRLHL